MPRHIQYLVEYEAMGGFNICSIASGILIKTKQQGKE